LLAKLLEGAVAITRGGARFLHSERVIALTRFQLLRHMTLPEYRDIFDTELEDRVVMYVRLGQHNISRLDTGKPVSPGSESSFLTRHPKLPLQEVIIDTSVMNLRYMLDLFGRIARPQTEGILEWARLNPGKIGAFFGACMRDQDTSKKFRPIYESLRMIHLRVLDRQPREIPACEANILKYQHETVQSKRDDRERVEAHIEELLVEREALGDDIDHLLKTIAKGKLIDRSEFRGPAQRPPRAEAEEAARVPVRDRIGLQPLNNVERRRRGQRPEDRAREFAAVDPVRLPDRGVPVEGETTKWLDGDEDPEFGRASSPAEREDAEHADFRAIHRVE
jgi:hypothetical protein